MPWATLIDEDHHLTPIQRYFYLVGGLHWFTDLFNFLATLFLVLVGLFSLFPFNLNLSSVAGPLAVLPLIFLVVNLSRFVWVLRHALKLSWHAALRAMYALFSLSWVITVACFHGLVQSQGVFLRTPKFRGESKAFRALQIAWGETSIGLLCAGTGLAIVAVRPTIFTLFLAIMLWWQSSMYLSALAHSFLSILHDV